MNQRFDGVWPRHSNQQLHLEAPQPEGEFLGITPLCTNKKRVVQNSAARRTMVLKEQPYIYGKFWKPGGIPL